MSASETDRVLNDLIVCVQKFGSETASQWDVANGALRAIKQGAKSDINDVPIVYEITYRESKLNAAAHAVHSATIPNRTGGLDEPLIFDIVVSGPDESQLKRLADRIRSCFFDFTDRSGDEYTVGSSGHNPYTASGTVEEGSLLSAGSSIAAVAAAATNGWTSDKPPPPSITLSYLEPSKL